MKSPVPACILAASWLLLGCVHPASAPEPEPAVDIPSNWSESASADAQVWPDVDWWKQFGSDELTRLVDEGRKNNLEIAAAIARVRQAESAARIAGAPLLPEVNATASSSHTIGVGGASSYTASSASLNIGYEVDFWGRIQANLVAAEASLKANRFDQETVALTVTSGIVSTYLQVLSLRDQLAIAEENIAIAERVLKLVDAQSRAGAASPLDLARQRSVVASQKAIIPDLLQQERQAQAALAILLGRPAQGFTVEEHGLGNIRLPEVTPGLPSELLSRRPDIRRAEADLNAANANVAAARAALFPSIHLSGSAGTQSSALLSLFNGKNLLVDLGADLVAPIFNADRLKNERNLAIAQQEELLHVYRATVIGAFAEVDNELGMIHSLAEQYKLKQGEMEQARLAFNLSEIRYRAGAEDLMTVLDTQRALSGVRNALGQLKLDQLQAIVSLYKTLGGGWRDVPDSAPQEEATAALR
jgi:NodT family efflux transporter outer membrane factor (OMF) lipoprotein